MKKPTLAGLEPAVFGCWSSAVRIVLHTVFLKVASNFYIQKFLEQYAVEKKN